MDKQILEAISKLIQHLEKFNEPHSFWGIDYKFFWPSLTVITSLIIAIFVPWYTERLRRRPKKSNLVIMNISRNQQGKATVGRLVIKNKSKVRAMNVEAYVETIIDNGKERENYLPVPLLWTHGQVYNTRVRRDISGNQAVYLDIFYYKEVDNAFRLVLGTPIRSDNFYILQQGKTELKINIYQESGQVVSANPTIIWEDGKIPEIII